METKPDRKGSTNTLREILNRAEESPAVNQAEKRDISKLVAFACTCYGLEAPDPTTDKSIRYAIQRASTKVTLIEMEYALIWNMHGALDKEAIPYRGMTADFFLKVLGAWEEYKSNRVMTNNPL